MTATPAADPMIKADRLHLTNIIYNLLDNAIKYCHHAPEILVSTENEPSGSIAVAVQDNGIGISEENQRKIFSKFYRVPTGNVDDVKGFGLGLKYVAIVVKAHRGTVSLKSAVGKGSTFYLQLPQ